jgi:peptidoglycan/xylan/chitin deacetylase (PgdA/CDA1 family)
MGLALLAPLVLGAQAAPMSDQPEVMLRSPISRSIVCPVLYTHEILSQAVMYRLITGLMGAGYHPQLFSAVDDAMSGLADPPPGCIVLTFDDGLLSQFTNAVPVLVSLGVPAVFFVLPGFADGVHRYMTFAQYEALALLGFEVENHTCNHPLLPQLARRNLDAFFAELDDCKSQIEAITGETVDYVAYPSGSYDATVLDAVGRFGYRAAFTTRPSALLTAASPYTLPRIRYDPSEPVATVLSRIHAAGG